MKTIKTVNGWEIKYNPNGLAPYQIKYGKGVSKVVCYRTLEGAENWAKKN